MHPCFVAGDCASHEDCGDKMYCSTSVVALAAVTGTTINILVNCNYSLACKHAITKEKSPESAEPIMFVTVAGSAAGCVVVAPVVA